jgi:hypothetical protein
MDLPGLSATNKPSYGSWAFARGSAEQKTSGFSSDMRLFAGGLDGERVSGLPLDCIVRRTMEDIVLSCVSHINPASHSVTASVPNRRPAARRSSASAYAALRVTVSTCGGPSANAELGTWESGTLAWLRRV